MYVYLIIKLSLQICVCSWISSSVQPFQLNGIKGHINYFIRVQKHYRSLKGLEKMPVRDVSE